MDLVDRRREPGGVELLGVDAGVGDAFLVGLEHQLFGARVPTLAELGAAHSENRDLVLDTPCHVGPFGGYKTHKNLDFMFPRPPGAPLPSGAGGPPAVRKTKIRPAPPSRSN